MSGQSVPAPGLSCIEFTFSHIWHAVPLLEWSEVGDVTHYNFLPMTSPPDHEM